MTPRSFWLIFLKILGFLFAFQTLSLFPEFISSWFFYQSEDHMGLMAMSFIVFLSALGFYLVVLHYCFFKTEWIIDKLGLDKGFLEERFEFIIAYHTVLTIAIIVLGGLMLVDSIPQLVRRIFAYFDEHYRVSRYGLYPRTGWIIFYAVKAYLGYFFVLKSQAVIAYIEKWKK